MLLMDKNWNQTPSSENPLAPFLEKPIHLLISGNVLREQVKVTLTALGFTKITEHPPVQAYAQSVQQLGRFLLQARDALFLVGPPMDGGGSGAKEFSDFFSDVRLILDKANRDVMKTLSMCVPIFEDIEFVHKRERIVLSLVEFGVSGVFILSKQDPLKGLTPQRKKALYQQQLKERFIELKEYLDDFLPQMDTALEVAKEKWEERKLSEKKAEAEEMMRKAEDLKRTGNFEEAVTALKQAIELYPADPRAYMESGRVYVRMKKYPNALKRFHQAEEVAEKLPEPNKEIGNVRVLQAKELIRAGEPADSPNVQKLLEDAVDNYGRALLKAEEVKRSDSPGENDKNVNAVVAIAGDILKLELDELLGENHPAVARFKSMARDSMMLMGGKNTDDMSGRQLIFLGQTAMDQGNFEGAEKYFHKAANQKEFFTAACNEIIYMGQLVRRKKGPQRAIGIYRRLLERTPPNISAVFFNMAVAQAEAGEELDAVCTLCRGIWQDPELPQNPMFYHNPKLFAAIDHLAWLRQSIKRFSAAADADPSLLQRGQLLETLLLRLARKQAKEGLPLLLEAIRMKGFFQWEFAFFDPALQQFIRAMCVQTCRSANPKAQKLGNCLRKVATAQQKKTAPDGFIPFKKEVFQLLREINTDFSPQETLDHFVVLVTNHHDYFRGPNFFTMPSMRKFTSELSTKLEHIDPSRLRR